ncbi:PAP/25A associated domain protein [Oesophagostomum dentatum]|uniref:PAP/25A associated domain protein n=1 Tax=Oesophagostomum dentatum TaxID=61180 RepID=A0A0B1SYE7_OESDE|nr:PAP/25A associated domain protein [Oesophagostomum dentatum]
MDDSEVIVSNKYSVSLLHQPRFNAIFIRVRWQGSRDSISICAMLEFGSSESVIRSAVEECANDLQRCDYNVRRGDRYPVSRSSEGYLKTHHIVVMDKRMKEKRDLMDALPEMCDGQLEAINSAIKQLESSTEGEDPRPIWEQRMELANIVENLLKTSVFEKMRVRGHVRVYGSTVAKTAIAASDLNLTIDIPDVDCSDAVETMKHVADLLNESAKETVDGFEARFVAETPMCIRMTMSNVLVRITWRRENGIKLGSLLGTYAAIRPQYPEFCRVVRKWAEVCGIYSVERRQGGLTSYAFDLMVLYFLQQKGLLPCLHEMRPMMVDEKKALHVIDDYFEKKDFYENNIDKINEKFGILDEPWDLARLFVEFLQFFGSRLHQSEVVQVVTKNVITRDKTRWSRKLLQIADPFRTDNVVTFTKAYQVYFFNCFLKSYLYFAIPQTVEGPLVDVTLYQKMGESPRKKKGKRKKPANGSTPKQPPKEESVVEQPVSNIIESIANIDIDDEEYTAAADALAMEEEQKAEIRNRIMDNFMPVPKLLNPMNMVLDARTGRMEVMDAASDLQHFRIACINGLTLKADKAKDVMKQLVATAEAVKSTGADDELLGCSLVDLPDKLCGSYMLPKGQAFLVPKQSACGIFVSRCWISRITDINREKKGICEITLRLSQNHQLKLLLCKEFCNTYPVRRLKERVESFKSLEDTSVVVVFSSERTSERVEIELAEECEALGMDVWTGLLKDEMHTFIATMCRDDVLIVEDLTAEEVEHVAQLEGCYVVRALIRTPLEDISEPSENFDEFTAATIERVAAKMESSRRKKENKLRRAERRRKEKEQAAQLLEKLIEEEKAELRQFSPDTQGSEVTMSVDDLVAQEALCVKSADDGEVVESLSQPATPSKSARRKRNRKKKVTDNRSSAEAESTKETLRGSSSQQSSSTNSSDAINVEAENAKKDDAILKNIMDTSAQQQEKENQPKPLICYEDFFITMKKFDMGSFKSKVDGLGKDSFVYSFDSADNFNNGYIPTAEPITHEKEQFEWTELDQVILGTYERNRVRESRIEQLGKTVELMRMFLQHDLHRVVRLDIFGSLVNGLGAGSSDVDICFRFETDEQPLNVDGVEIVKDISQSLQKMKGLEKVYAITGAKVPIVKFEWPKYGFEGE